MSRFAIRYPYLIIVICLITCVVGVTSLVRMPVDLFPPIKIPVVVVATFFNGHAARTNRERTSPAGLSGSSRWPAAWTTSNRVRCRA